MNPPANDSRQRPLAGALPWWQFLLIAGLFWAYVTLSNVLYAHSFGSTLAHLDAEDLFAPWDQRVLQHLLLFAPLVGCYGLSLHAGWRPGWIRLPLQGVLAVGFASLPHWMLMLAGKLIKAATGVEHKGLVSAAEMEIPDTPLWIASGTNFLLQYGFGLALITGFALYRRYRNTELQVEALERLSSAARLSALRLQLSPHTLFNLLNTIRGQIGWDPAAAQQLVVQLSDLLRRLLNAGEREFSLLGEELQFVRLYLGLQQSRFPHRLRIDLPAPGSVPALWVPSLILQPLVENAVAHGMAGHDGPVRVSVEVAVDGETLVLTVVNDVGPGSREGEGGIGLRNVSERLAAHFGDRAGLRTQRAAGSWRATVTLPAVTSR